MKSDRTEYDDDLERADEEDSTEYGQTVWGTTHELTRWRRRHDRDDEETLWRILLPLALAELSDVKPAYNLMENRVAHLQIAWAGRAIKTKAIRLGLIGCVPAHEIMREIGVTRAAVDKQECELKKQIRRAVFVHPVERLNRLARRNAYLNEATKGTGPGKDVGNGKRGKFVFNALAKSARKIFDSIPDEWKKITRVAWNGGTPRAKAISLGLIAGVPIREIANRVGLPFRKRKRRKRRKPGCRHKSKWLPARRYTQHVYDQHARIEKVVKTRSIITCAAAQWKVYQKAK
jgi:hypothetical protein